MKNYALFFIIFLFFLIQFSFGQSLKFKEMKYPKPYWFLILLYPLLTTQCVKSSLELKLPPVTTEGKNTFGCRVNGKIWEPRVQFGFVFTPKKIDINYSKVTQKLSVSSNREIDDIGVDQKLYFVVKNISSVGIYDYDIASFNNYDTSFCFNNVFELDTTSASKLKIIHLDTLNRIISGTFEYVAVNDECDPVIITDGRFDWKY